MPAPLNNPTYIKNKERYFMEVAKTVASASTHPLAPGGCILVRDREIIGDGRSVLTGSKIEIDCLTYAIGSAAKRGTPTIGAHVYTTRYPFCMPIFQCYLMGITKIYVLAHEWEPFYKDEFRRAARLARECSITIEPIFETDDERFSGSPQTEEANPFKTDEYDPQYANEIHDELPPTV